MSDWPPPFVELVPQPGTPEAAGPLVRVDSIPAPAPLAPGEGMDALDPGLARALFGPDLPAMAAAPGDDRPLRTFALLDAALVMGLPEMLAASDLAHDCLFAGKAATEMADVAPWLVELEPDHRLTRMLLTTVEAPGGLAERQAGAFLRSRAPLATLRAHLRRFTRLRDETGRWLMFRLWSPAGVALLARGNHEAVRPLAGAVLPTGPDALAVIGAVADGVVAVARLDPEPTPRRAVRLDAGVRAHLSGIRAILDHEELVGIALHQAEAHAEGPFDAEAARPRLRAMRPELRRMGFVLRDQVAQLLVWEAMLGPDFLRSHDGGRVRELVMTSEQGWIAVARIRRHLLGLEDMTPEERGVAG